MIAGDDDVDLAAAGADEDGVGRKRPRDVNPSPACGGNRRRNRRCLLTAEQPVLASMRVQTGDRDARCRDAEARQLARRQRDRRLERFPGNGARHVGQRDVHRGEHDTQRLRVEHHRDVGGTGQMREEIRVAVPRQAGQAKRLFVHRCCGDGVDGVLLRIRHRTHDHVVRGAARVGAQHAGWKDGTVRRRVQHGVARVAHA